MNHATKLIKKSQEIRAGRHCVYNLHVHLVFVTKYRQKIFTSAHLELMRKVFNDICIDYARVSTLKQNLELQTDALTVSGCEEIITDEISGSMVERPRLNKLLEKLRHGDELIVWRLDRLGRSIRHLIELINNFHTRGIIFRSLTENIDTSTNLN